MIPTQETVDWKNPAQHFTWALRNMPTVAGIGAVTHPSILEGWSEHLWACGFAHRDYLVSLADEDGNIHVSKLPEQTIRWQSAFRGPKSTYNGASRWVSEDAEPVQPMRLPDIRDLTQQENAYMLQQYREAGWLEDNTIGPPLAGEVE